MIHEAMRAVRLFKSDSLAETVIALALVAGVVLTLIETQR